MNSFFDLFGDELALARDALHLLRRRLHVLGTVELAHRVRAANHNIVCQAVTGSRVT